VEEHHPEDEHLQKVLTRLTEENPASVAEIIQLWLAEDEKH
jgi:flagellar biosynthesis/type III secretory pathway M-ring protein FliF/YscJ